MASTPGAVTNRLFLYGTLMSSFRCEARQRVEPALERIGCGVIRAVLYDLGPYPAALPAPAAISHSQSRTHSDARAWQGNAQENRVRGEVYRMLDPPSVVRELDEFEGYDASRPDSSLFVRVRTTVELVEGGSVDAWVYFYGRPLCGATRIDSGDYLSYVKSRGLLPGHHA